MFTQPNRILSFKLYGISSQDDIPETVQNDRLFICITFDIEETVLFTFKTPNMFPFYFITSSLASTLNLPILSQSISSPSGDHFLIAASRLTHHLTLPLLKSLN